MPSYWNKVLTKRVSRRRAIASTGALTASAAFLAACGGDDDDDSSGGSSSSGASSSSGGSSGAAPTAPPAATASAQNLGAITADLYGASASTDTPKMGGTYGDTYTSSNNLNILTNASEYAAFGGQYVYDHMITTRTNPRSPYVLEAAEALDQPDEITLTFKLRQGMKYHNFAPVNGREVVAEDVKLAQEYILPLDNVENTFQKFFLDRVETPDQYTVTYVLKEPRAYLFDSRQLGHPGPQAIIPHETFDGLDTERQIGSGPFMLDEWTISTKNHYIRNPEYHSYGQGEGTLPYRDATDVYILPDNAAIEAAMRSGQVSEWIPPPAQFDDLLSSMGAQAQAQEYLGLNPQTWNMNMDLEKFQDERFRQAFYRATNRQQYIDLVWKGNAETPTGILAVSMTPYQLDASETDEYFKYDPAEGKKLMDALGYDGAEVEVFYIGPSSTSDIMAEILKQQVAEIGVPMRIVTYGLAEALPRTQRREYEMFIGGHPGYDTPSVPMRHNHSVPNHQFEVSGLKDPTLDAMIEKAEKTTDFEENIKLVKEAQLYAVSHYTSYYNIATPVNRRLLNGKIRNYEIEASNTGMHQAQMWFDA
jgi:peptide/nickel transport system substrate-binding protein